MPDTLYSHPVFGNKMMAIYGCFETQGLKFWTQRIHVTTVALLISNGKHISHRMEKSWEQAENQASLRSKLRFGMGLADGFGFKQGMLCT